MMAGECARDEAPPKQRLGCFRGGFRRTEPDQDEVRLRRVRSPAQGRQFARQPFALLTDQCDVGCGQLRPRERGRARPPRRCRPRPARDTTEPAPASPGGRWRSRLSRRPERAPCSAFDHDESRVVASERQHRPADELRVRLVHGQDRGFAAVAPRVRLQPGQQLANPLGRSAAPVGLFGSHSHTSWPIWRQGERWNVEAESILGPRRGTATTRAPRCSETILYMA